MESLVDFHLGLGFGTELTIVWPIFVNTNESISIEYSALTHEAHKLHLISVNRNGWNWRLLLGLLFLKWTKALNVPMFETTKITKLK